MPCVSDGTDVQRDLRTILWVQALRAFLYGFGTVILGTALARSGLAEAYSGVGDAGSALAGGKGLSADQRREYWAQAHAAYQKSLTLWNDKEKRGELESGEHDERALVAQHVAESERHIAPLSSKRGGPN